MKPFQASRIKIERAKKHLQEFVSEIDGFFARDAVKVVLEYADEFKFNGLSPLSYTFRQSEPLPSNLSAILGDVIHNLRVSLDLVATDCYRISGGDSELVDSIYFPFSKNEEIFDTKVNKRPLSSINAALKAIIESTKPYPTENPGLYAIHKFDIQDKHTALVPVVLSSYVPFPILTQGPEQGFSTVLAKDGQRLVTYPTTVIPAPVGSRYPVKFLIVFDFGSVFQGNEIVPQLEQCIASIAFILESFIDAVRKDPNLEKLLEVDLGS